MFISLHSSEAVNVSATVFLFCIFFNSSSSEEGGKAHCSDHLKDDASHVKKRNCLIGNCNVIITDYIIKEKKYNVVTVMLYLQLAMEAVILGCYADA